MVDHGQMKLGKQPPKIDLRTLRLARYLTSNLPTPPPSCDWTNGQSDWGMMLNDNLGDCTIAAVAHAIQVWTLVINQQITVSDDVVQQYYETWDGYNPADPSTDQGGVEVDVLNNWRASSFAGHKLLAYADPDPRNILHVKQSIALFGGVYIGISLPVSAQNQEVWDAVDGPDGEPGSWGGHAVFVAAYDADTLTCITWGAPKKMTWAFWHKYCDESHALLSPDFMTQNGQFPSGFDLAQLQADLEVITGA